MPLMELEPEVGLLHQMWAHRSVSDAELITSAIEELSYADHLGFSSVWIGEHHGVKPDAPFYGRVPASEILLSHLAATMPRIRVGTGVKVLSTTSVLRAAEEMAMLDLITGGRSEFGLGQGAADRNNVGISREQKSAMFRSQLGDLLDLLQGDTRDDLPQLSPTPSPTITEKIWIAARDEQTIEEAAFRNLRFVVGQAEGAELQGGYIARYRAAGGTKEARGVRVVFVADSNAEAQRRCEASVDLYYSLMSKGFYFVEPSPDRSEALSDFTRKRRAVHYIAGDPETVATELNEYTATTKVDRLDVMMQLPLLESEAIRSSMALFCREVRPSLEVGSHA
jgi:alkanesulfonate monooxygenase SsuD/methylene tetrahydromethanopterin reductase-like flavin-dependent oxidoreductase (luciferase family)